MVKGFWKTLKKPIMVLAPMADVTDPAFRRIIAKYSKWGGVDIGDGRRESLPAKARGVGGPDVMWTEFVSADGLVRAPEEGRKKLLADLQYTEAERPIVAQFFTSNPDHMEQVARLAVDLGFDGIDINMGCPDKSIEKQGAGANHIKHPENAVAVIEAAKRGAGDIPVSVKTRLGYNKDELDEWLPRLLKTDVSAITLHARTRKEMSKVPARWERVQRAVELRDQLAPETLILGNGDALSLRDAHEKVALSGADGVMLGRAIFGNPWLFSPSQEGENNGKGVPTVPLAERLRVMVEHTKLFEELLPHKNFAIMKKHYKAYVADFDGASGLRATLMEAQNSDEVEDVVNQFLKKTL